MCVFIRLDHDNDRKDMSKKAYMAKYEGNVFGMWHRTPFSGFSHRILMWKRTVETRVSREFGWWAAQAGRDLLGD